MLRKSKSMEVNGTSIVQVDGKDTVAMIMHASFPESGIINSNKNIQDKAVYLANKAAVDADYTEFDEYVNSLMEV